MTMISILYYRDPADYPKVEEAIEQALKGRLWHLTNIEVDVETRAAFNQAIEPFEGSLPNPLILTPDPDTPGLYHIEG
jgi:hypothetical protein